MKNRKAIKYLINTIFIWTSISLILVVNTTFKPSDVAFVVGFFIALFLLAFLLYELSVFKEESSTGLVVDWRFSKFVVMGMYFFGFCCMGVYGVAFPLHSVIEEKHVQIHGVRPIKSRKIRLFYCDTRVKILISEVPYKSKVHCATKREFDFLKSVSLSEPYKKLSIVYEKSIFGEKIVALQNIN